MDCYIKIQYTFALRRIKASLDERQRKKETYQGGTWQITPWEKIQKG